jgi:hypothetical protein
MQTSRLAVWLSGGYLDGVRQTVLRKGRKGSLVEPMRVCARSRALLRPHPATLSHGFAPFVGCGIKYRGFIR